MSSISLETLANRAGISKTTASLIINGRAEKYGISPVTQEKVLKLARKYNYQANQYARGLRLKKTGTIGLIIPDVGNIVFAEEAHVLTNACRAEGINLIVASSEDRVSQERDLIKDLESRYVDGLIIASAEPMKGKTPATTVPTVLIDRTFSRTGMPQVGPDNYKGAFTLTDRLCRDGAKKIHYIGGTPDLSPNIQRLAGYKDALKTNGIRFSKKRVWERDNKDTSGYILAQKIFAKGTERPDAIFCFAYKLFEQVLFFMQEQFGSVPDDIAYATFDDHPLLRCLPVKVHSVRQDTRNIALTSFGMLKDLMAGKKPRSTKVVSNQLFLR